MPTFIVCLTYLSSAIAATLYEEIDDAFAVLPPQGRCAVAFWQYQSWQTQEWGHGRTASAAQALAAFRNAVAGTLYVEGWPYLPNGFRYCQHHLQSSLRWIGTLAT